MRSSFPVSPLFVLTIFGLAVVLLNFTSAAYTVRKLRRGYTLDFNTSNSSLPSNASAGNVTNTSCTHGKIVEQVGCLCNSNAELGFWEPRGLCDSCAQNYAGINCTLQCPGGSCNPCSSHGVCNQGQQGDGTCRCNADSYLGFWDGSDCSDCLQGYYGSRCLDPCPGFVVGVGVVCFGHGACLSGSRGSGRCVCFAGWGSASGCSDCDISHYGAGCSAVCPGTTSRGLPCSGHGSCFFGLSGNGTCSCEQNFVGTACSLECPFGCFGHGVCVGSFNETQECQCFSHWAPPYCEYCQTNRAGSSCGLVCTQTPFNMVCFNNGTCADDNGVAVCNCTKGYASYQGSCDAKCPGTPPCGGHGVCYANPQTLASATCLKCDFGWTGPTCSECDVWHANSENCTILCPGRSLPCSGHGVCLRGECICSPGFCGTSCNATANCSACPTGLFGPLCNNSCPVDSGRICSNNGYCGLDGRCRCVPGYFGPSCNRSCAIGINGLVCSGITQGICFTSFGGTLSCQCINGFVGDACSYDCPTAVGLPCRGNGICRFDSNSTSYCDCFAGWTGKVCDIVCLCNSEHGRCSSSCDNNPSFKPCSDCVCDSHFTGQCKECVPGLQGPQCDGPCVEGTTVGTECVCNQHWSGTSCDVECPKNVSGVYCSGHGLCTSIGTCLCQSMFYGPACAVYCDVAITCSRIGKNAQCNSVSGVCECLIDPALGHWAIGPDGTCDATCAPGFWGPSCVEFCNCNDRGSCSKFSGSCACYDNEAMGHFAGDTCSVCASGYIGVQCTQKNVQITRLQASDNTSIAFTQPYSVVSLAFVDDDNHRMLVGNSPLSVVNLSAVNPFISVSESDEIARLVPLNAQFILATASDAFLHLVTVFNSSTHVLTFTRSSLRLLAQVQISSSGSADSVAGSSNGNQTIIVWSNVFSNYTQWSFAVFDAVCFNDTSFVGCTNTFLNGSGFLPVPNQFAGEDVQVSVIANDTYRIVLCGNESRPNSTTTWEALVFDLVPHSLSPVRVPVSGGSPSIRRLVPCWPTLDLSGGACNETCVAAVRSTFFGLGIILAIQTANDTAVAWIRPFEIVGKEEQSLVLLDGTCQTVRTSSSQGRYLCSNCSQQQWSVLVATMQQVSSIPTAIAVDRKSSVMYLALRSTASLSVLVKLRLDPAMFSLYGKKELNLVQGQLSLIPESFYAMSIAPSTSSLYSVASFVASLTLGVFLVYDVTSIAPSLADIRNGTVVNISGSGFSSPANCLFNGTVVPAKVVSANLLQCVPPALDSITTSDSCSGLPVDVSLFGGRYPSDSGVTLSRVQKPELQDLDPVKDSFQNSTVTVIGSNFVNSNYGVCRFVAVSRSAAGQPPLYGVMTFVNPSRVICARPTATQSQYNVDIALDGQQYSGSPLSFLVVGAANSIVVTGRSLYSASPATNVSGTVRTVDTLGNPLDVLDGARLSVCLLQNVSQDLCSSSDYFSWRFEGDGFPWPPCGNASITAQDSLNDSTGFCQTGKPHTGAVNFPQISVLAPRAGVLNLSFFSTMYGVATLSVTITEGAPYALRVSNLLQFTDTSAPYAVPKSSLLKAVRIFVCDVLGNICSNITFALPTALASVQKSTPAGWLYVSNSSADSELNNVNGFRVLQFSQITAPFIHGVSYRTVFTNPGLVPCTTPTFETELCQPVEYKVPLTYQCNSCPAAGAICNGSAVVLMEPGYWRAASSTVQIFPCPIVDACLGDAISGNGSFCFNGSTGPLCTLCQQGYGKTKTTTCQQCLPVAPTVAIFALAVLVAFVVLVVWSFFTVREQTTTNISIVLRTIVNHMQTTGQLGEFSQQFSPFLRSIFNIQGGSSSINMSGFQTLDCLLEYSNRTYVSVFVGYMCLPLAAPIVSTVLFGVLRLFKMKPVLSGDLQREIEEELRALGTGSRLSRIREQYPFYFVFTTVVCVIVFTLYQTLIQQAANVLKCVNLGPGQSFLQVDMSIKCDDNGTSALTTPGLLFAVGYGFGIPLGFVCAYVFFKGRLGKPALTNFVFMFLVGGYKQKYWYWQAVIMVRKLLLVMVNVFIPKELLELQNYCAMWVMLVALVLQLWLKPNIEDMHNNVEAFSLAAITITLNFGLIYFWPAVPSGANEFITVCLIILTLFCIVVFAYYLYEPLREELAKVEVGAGQLIASVLSGKNTDRGGESDAAKKRRVIAQRPARLEQEYDDSTLAVPDRAASAQLSFANFARNRGRLSGDLDRSQNSSDDDKPANLEHLLRVGDEY